MRILLISMLVLLAACGGGGPVGPGPDKPAPVQTQRTVTFYVESNSWEVPAFDGGRVESVTREDGKVIVATKGTDGFTVELDSLTAIDLSDY